MEARSLMKKMICPKCAEPTEMTKVRQGLYECNEDHGNIKTVRVATSAYVRPTPTPDERGDPTKTLVPKR